jgi:signal peptidase I
VFFIVLLLRSFLFEPFRIPSGSLEPTLLVGDFLVVNKFAYGLRLPVLEKKFIPIANPKKGEIAIFRWPPNPSFDYIKRVIGVPGDHVVYHNKVLTINGQEMKQTFVEYTMDESSGRAVAQYKEDLNGVQHDIFVRPDVEAVDIDVTVPEGHYFMMGDNRDDSADSRYWGFVPDENLRGKALLIWMSWNGKTDIVRWNRLGTIIQ